MSEATNPAGQAVSDVVRIVTDASGRQLAMFSCPGCCENHGITVECKNDRGASWSWNGDKKNPTFSPSILTRFSRMTELGKQQYRDWSERKIATPERFDSVDMVCHCWIRNGQIQFLDDCTHDLKGKSVPLRPIES